MEPPHLLGWASSVVLVLTIGWQVFRQWRSGTSAGVSRWLFLGQACASAGFTGYSLLIGSRVFVVTNALLLVAALVGLGIVEHHRRRGRANARPPLGARVAPGRRVAGV